MNMLGSLLVALFVLAAVALAAVVLRRGAEVGEDPEVEGWPRGPGEPGDQIPDLPDAIYVGYCSVAQVYGTWGATGLPVGWDWHRFQEVSGVRVYDDAGRPLSVTGDPIFDQSFGPLPPEAP